MKSVSHLLAAGAALALSLGTLQSAKAGGTPNNFTFIDGGTSDVINISTDGGVTSENNVVAGAYDIKIDTVTQLGFCTAVKNSISNGDTTTGTLYSDINSAAPLTATGSYVDSTHHSKADNISAVAWITSNYLNSGDKDQRAYAAIAIWDVVNDGGDGAGAGQFRVVNSDAKYITGANMIIDNAYNNPVISNVGWEQTPKQSDGKYQDFAVDPIPEPAFYQMGAFLTGGGLLALRLRKRK